MASQYGYTIPDFMNLTLRQIHGLMTRIVVRKHNEFALIAQLHGAKIELRKIEHEVRQLTPKQRQTTDRAIKEAVNRIMKAKMKKL